MSARLRIRKPHAGAPVRGSAFPRCFIRTRRVLNFPRAAFYTWQADGRIAPNVRLKLIGPGMPGQPMYYVTPAKATNPDLARKFIELAICCGDACAEDFAVAGPPVRPRSASEQRGVCRDSSCTV